MAYKLATQVHTIRLCEPLPRFLKVGEFVEFFGGEHAGCTLEIIAMSANREEIQVALGKPWREAVQRENGS